MNLNFINLSNAQAELDGHISEEHAVDHNDVLREKAISLCVELGELLNERPFIFKYWSNKKGDRNLALQEYVDNIHFLISYGNAIGFNFENYEYKRPKELDQRDLVLGLFNIFSMMNEIQSVSQFKGALTYYLMLGENLNFTAGEVEEAYFAKNLVNHERAESGY